MMLFHSRFVTTTLAGRVVKWNAQARGEQSVTLRRAWADHWPAAAIGVLATLATALAAPAALPWLAPVVLGLILAAPVAALLASKRAGLCARRWGLWLTPEELDPPAVLRRHASLLAGIEKPAGGDPFEAVLEDPGFFALHSQLLKSTGGDRPLPPAERDRVLAAEPASLTPADRRAVLGDRATLAELHARAPRRTALGGVKRRPASAAGVGGRDRDDLHQVGGSRVRNQLGGRGGDGDRHERRDPRHDRPPPQPEAERGD